MKIKKESIITFSLILLILSVLSFGQQFNTVVVIDSAKTMQFSIEGKRVLSVLQQKEQQILSELSKLDNQAQSLETRLYTQKFTLAIEARDQMAKDLEALRAKRKKTEEDSTKEYNQLEFNLVTKIKTEVLPLIKDIAQEKGFSLVLDLQATGVAYFLPTIDITEEVIKRYDALKAVKKEG
jgi:Skp family chaperone for outer membrane proteins